MSNDLTDRAAINPDFGNGYFIRSTSFRRLATDRVEVVMEDPFHALAMRLRHDTTSLLEIEARWERHPLTSCAGAGDALTFLTGLPLVDDLRSRWLQAIPALQCTHMFDTLRLAAVHIARERPDRRYEVVMPDAPANAQPVQLFCDGAMVVEIEIDADFRIVAPPAYAGAPLLAGFARWATGRLSAEEFERLFLLQRGAFVGRGRRLDIVQYYGRAAELSGPATASCFGSQPEHYSTSLRLPNARPGLRREDAGRFHFG